jgi:hypothetical protein
VVVTHGKGEHLWVVGDGAAEQRGAPPYSRRSALVSPEPEDPESRKLVPPGSERYRYCMSDRSALDSQGEVKRLVPLTWPHLQSSTRMTAPQYWTGYVVIVALKDVFLNRYAYWVLVLLGGPLWALGLLCLGALDVLSGAIFTRPSLQVRRGV